MALLGLGVIWILKVYEFMTNLSYESILIQENGDPLVDLSTYPFILEPQYYNRGLSDSATLFARKSVADKLIRIQDQLEEMAFKIWDPWRSREVQNNIYQIIWKDLQAGHPDWDDEKLRFEVGVFATAATDPNIIPPHATGGAVDLTLVDSDGRELSMGTGFDHFGPEAQMFYFDNIEPIAEISANRRLLRDAMLEEDFSYYNDEWWHFDYGNQFWAALKGYEVAIYGEIRSAT